MSFISNLELGEKRKNLHKIINFITLIKNSSLNLKLHPKKKVWSFGPSHRHSGQFRRHPGCQSLSCRAVRGRFSKILYAKKVTHSTCPRENQGTLSSLFCLITLSIFVEKRWKKTVIPVIPQSSLEGRARRPQDPSLDVGQTGSQHLQGCKAGKAARAE